MIKSIWAKLVVLVVILSAFALAQDAETKMTPEEFQKILSGNTMIGEWDSSSYRQYFSENGTTIYLSNGSQSEGTWRIADDGKYCSVWPPSPAETCYTVTRRGEELIWYSGDNRYPAIVVEGDQLEE
jgi:hypothetical protein